MCCFRKKAPGLIAAFCAILALCVPAGGAGLRGDAAVYGLEGAFSDDIYVKISLSGYKRSDGTLQLEGLVSKMASYTVYVMEDSPADISLRFPASLINGLPGGIHDIMASSWNFQGRSEVTIPPTPVGRLFIKAAVPDAAIDYVTERLKNMRHDDGIPYRPQTGRQARYSFKRGNETVIVEPGSAGTFPIPGEWMTGDSVEIVRLNETESLSSDPQTLKIPKRRSAPWVFALGETSEGACDGRILGVSKAMEYSADGGVHWADCPAWKIEGLPPSGDYRVRFKAIQGKSFAGKQKKLVVSAADRSVNKLDWRRSRIDQHLLRQLPDVPEDRDIRPVFSEHGTAEGLALAHGKTKTGHRWRSLASYTSEFSTFSRVNPVYLMIVPTFKVYPFKKI